MNSTIELKNRIIHLVENADDRLLRMLNALIESYQSNESSIPEWHYEELDKRREKHLNGSSKSYTWEEAQNKIQKAVRK